jgi:hypothetical protein
MTFRTKTFRTKTFRTAFSATFRTMHIQDSYDVQDNVIVGVDAVHES